MATGKASCESSGDGGKFEIFENPQNDSQEAELNKSTGASEVCTQQGGNLGTISVTVGKSELEQLMKQMTFTRSEAQSLIALVHSGTMEESPSPVIRLETSSTSGPLTKIKHGDDEDNCHAAISSSRILDEEIANACKGSTIGEALLPGSKLIKNNATCLPKTPMASPQHPTTMENLPEELLSNIFIQLLAKQLGQMRSVSKSWNGLLSQSSFITSHLHRSIHNNDQILLVFYYCHEYISDFKPFAAYPSRPPHLELTNFIKLPVNPRPEYTNGIVIIGSVNGLICSSYGDFVIHVWNPSLSAVLTLPPYSMPSGGYDPIQIFFRFGFDPKTKDFKVVKFTGLTGPPLCVIKRWLDVGIYSMRKGTWELITERFPSHITDIIDSDHVCADGRDGHLHWLGGYFRGKTYSVTIVAFDLGSETFHEMPLPHSTLDNSQNILGVLAGKLCVVSWDEDVGCEVWVMEEYGVAESWVRRHVFSHFVGDIVPYGFTSRNEFLIDDNNGRLVLYDPSANEQKILKDHRPRGYHVDKIVEYVDSLVWVAPAEHEMVDGGGQI